MLEFSGIENKLPDKQTNKNNCQISRYWGSEVAIFFINVMHLPLNHIKSKSSLLSSWFEGKRVASILNLLSLEEGVCGEGWSDA